LYHHGPLRTLQFPIMLLKLVFLGELIKFQPELNVSEVVVVVVAVVLVVVGVVSVVVVVECEVVLVVVVGVEPPPDHEDN